MKENGGSKIEYMYSAYRHMMLSKAYAILKDRKLAEEALYNAFMFLWRNNKLIDDPTSSRSIVLAVTVTRNFAYALAEPSNEKPGPIRDRKGFNVDGIESALYEMSASDIVKAVNKLGGENKNIFLLRYSFGLSKRKIAKTLDETEAAVASRLQRAQLRLRAILLRGGYRRH